jgi:hypothetical protein
MYSHPILLNFHMPNFNGPPKDPSTSIERDQFSVTEDGAFNRTSERVFDSYRNDLDLIKDKDSEDEKWEDSVLEAESIMRKLSNPSGRKLLQENRTAANGAVHILTQGLQAGLEDHPNISPELRPKIERQMSDRRQLFAEAGKRLYADIHLFKSPGDTFNILKYGSRNFKNSVLGGWADSLDGERANELMERDPAALLKAIERKIEWACTKLSSAHLEGGSKDPSTAQEISIMGSGIYRLEMLRQDLEHQIAQQTPRAEASTPQSGEFVAGAVKRPDGSHDFSQAVYMERDAQKMKEVRERLGIPPAAQVPGTNEATIPDTDASLPPFYSDPDQPAFFKAKEAEYRKVVGEFFSAQRERIQETRELNPGEQKEQGRLLSEAETTVRKLSDPSIREQLQESPEEANELIYVLTRALANDLDGTYAAPESRTKQKPKDSPARLLFLEEGKRLYPSVRLLSPQVTLDSRSLEHLTNPSLKEWALSLTSDLTLEQPQALLEKLNASLGGAAQALELARSGKEPPHPFELVAVGKRILALELLRKTVERRIEVTDE